MMQDMQQKEGIGQDIERAEIPIEVRNLAGGDQDVDTGLQNAKCKEQTPNENLPPLETRNKGKPRAKLVLGRAVYKVNKGKTTILNNVSVSLTTGELVAVMGSSGCGKTTMVNLMTGVNPLSEGQIMLNGSPVAQKVLRSTVIYVPQDDLLLHTMTTYEAVLEATKFNNSDGASKEELEVKVNSLLRKFNLHECRDVRIGSAETKKGLSGGQRKRLCIALEMISSKSFLILDEPTSGLDSASAKSVVSVLRKTANEGTGILATIHSPSADIFFKFDKVLLLVKGQMAYFGKTKNMIDFFSEVGFTCPEYTNPADWAIDLLTINQEFDTEIDEERVLKIVQQATPIEVVHGTGYQAHVRSEEQQPKSASVLPNAKPSEDEGGAESTISTRDSSQLSTYGGVEKHKMLPLMSQVVILLQRNFLHMRREPSLGRARFGSHIIIGIVIGILYFEISSTAASVPERIALNLFCLIFLMLTCALPTVITFLPERAVFIKEQRNRRYSVSAFYIAKTLSDLPLQLIPAFIFFTIVYFMSKYGGEDLDGERYGYFLLTLLMHVLTVHSWATFIACIASSLSVAIFLVPISFVSFSNDDRSQIDFLLTFIHSLIHHFRCQCFC